MDKITENLTGDQGAVDFINLTLARLGELAANYAMSMIGAILVLIVGIFIAGYVQRWAERSLSRIRGFDRTISVFFAKVIYYAIMVLVGVTVLAQFGVRTTSIIAALGAVGLAIGLALQGTLQNVAAGIMLLVLRPFRVGEFVQAGGISGTVNEIGLFATEFTSYDGLYMLVPNSQLLNEAVTNFTRRPTRMFDLSIGIGYDDDIGAAQKIMMGLAESDERVLKEPAPITFVTELGDSSVTVVLRYWTATTDFWPTRRDMTKLAKQKFDADGISIPFPQRDVHLFEEKKVATPGRSTARKKTAAGQ